jgi:hypothetical protein
VRRSSSQRTVCASTAPQRLAHSSCEKEGFDGSPDAAAGLAKKARTSISDRLDVHTWLKEGAWLVAGDEKAQAESSAVRAKNA